MTFNKLAILSLLFVTVAQGQGLTSRQIKASTIKNGAAVLTLPSSTDTLIGKATTDIFTNKTIDADGTGNSISNIENADIKTGAAITRTKLANGTASHVLINDGSGIISSEANLTVSRGGTGAGSFTADSVLLGNGTSAFQLVAPSTSGNVLTSNGTTWTSAAPTGGTVVAIACSNAAQSVSTSAATKVLFANESVDTANAFASSTFTMPSNGNYAVDVGIYMNSVTIGQDSEIRIYKNGSIFRQKFHYIDAAATYNDLSHIVNGVATDTIEIYITSGGDTSYTIEDGGGLYTCLSIAKQ